MNRSRRSGAGAGSVRIIGGRWRGSRLPVDQRPGLRPTADRVRETVFNWLAPVIHGARCLDLFAGSGALGFEAASRGAASVLLVERDPELAASLRQSAARLGADTVEVRCGDALALLDAMPGPFDLVFVDPPFAAGLWPQVFERLVGRLSRSALVYVEAPVDAPPQPPAGWQRHREARTRDVCYALLRPVMSDA